MCVPVCPSPHMVNKIVGDKQYCTRLRRPANRKSRARCVKCWNLQFEFSTTKLCGILDVCRSN